MMVDVPTRKSEFEAALRALTQTYDAMRENPGSYQSENNVRCMDCMFTTHSRDAYQCTYCSHVVQCAGLTHCHHCTSVTRSSYCQHSSFLSGCSYVMYSSNCHECVFCFGCVGLVKKEFHILNVPFKRDAYFRIVKELEVSFGLKGRG